MSFSFHRGSLALDFAGTMGSRGSDAPEERLPDTEALAAWLRAASLVDDARAAPADLERAHKLREAIFALGLALVTHRPLDGRALVTLNAAADGLRHGSPHLDPRGHVHWTSDAPVALALARVALDAIERFAGEAERLAICELPGCGALLLSRSRSDRRRWCSMEQCGNRAKVAAYRARHAGRH